MNKFCFEWIQEWCEENGWTDPFQESKQYWAFPPFAVMPLPIPNEALEVIKLERGLTSHEKYWNMAAWSVSVCSAAASVYAHSPMPIMIAFAFCAFVFGMMDE
ncbi:hypothetical protein ACQ4M4_01590 [Leptolyngbya sp. AN02str]|uniref:slr1957 family protein n=1 Tax=Leptolyngbya sp. AN02str TaxID=3423363 RepID=UPI003D31B0E4